MLILVTNDDGVRSPGLRALALALGEIGDVVVVAPDRNRSAVGHALTLDQPLRAEEIKTDVFAVDGTPTDCVNLGIHGLLSQRPDLVVSGINGGLNVGDDISYSGTVCAALEATLMGLPAFAISLDTSGWNKTDLSVAAQFAKKLALDIINHGLPEETFLNVNIPRGGCSGVELTTQGKRKYSETVIVKEDPRGRKYYWIGGTEAGFVDLSGSDCNAVQRGFISVTPVRTNMTHEKSYIVMQQKLFDCLKDNA
ncbi:5'-nucleotidase /3'-nucleotidase /exopolyphosphatase [Desulfuromusa kysingii]|uniref:5'-nucleotidase SurE n=1 Tax=Desulfuromusa kysingii TaxID=37625 RepID=A0A1H4D545_9BACT|nr:5'/3'-nucleotidase SurE [Desulfuromusa kysingii]SEA67559.1 5'-nucleotidase /3'-nucleotidase /exopolyphosphatase [Desulfuromusa kysingii]